MAVLEIAAVVALTYAAGKEVIDFIEGNWSALC